jgi:argininosuccinate synthase
LVLFLQKKNMPRAKGDTMKRPEDIKKIVLMYSGGLDTSVMLTWLKEHYPNSEVIAVAGDVGQGEELDGLEEKALATGASKVYVLDLKQEFVEDFIWATLKAGARYEREYLLGTAFARPVIAKHVAEIARREGVDARGRAMTRCGLS